MMKNTGRIFNYLLCMLLGLGYGANGFADNNSRSNDFEAWKARQQQHDARLKQVGSASILQQRVVQVQPVQPLHGDEKLRVQQLGTQLKLNINTATSDEIVAKLEGIGRKKAQAIIDYRNQHGTFKKVDDVLNVKGFGPKTLDKNRDRIQLSD
ncbi:ComEA family DNA-binding protein [Acinetobacter puyangensis]|uniref:Competence protein ComEA n=1 Tax=Acinetobacter puyangensis TaxID=1096779 RepID=A0A240ECP3_9GAMM|nr:ComEA family DNA-binding protein [Acinetobacter puyangensis]SNX46462.1 competence protein ComEA [Acinetobacter puyangensis]